MSESSINVTEGSGKRLHSWDRTINATLVQDQFMLPGEYPLAAYTVSFEAISTATGGDHIFQIMAGASNYVRIRRIYIQQDNNATTAGAKRMQILRLSTAGTGGSVVTPAKFDSGDGAATATAMTLPTVKGTESTLVMPLVVVYRQTVSTTTGGQNDGFFEWTQHPGTKPIIIPAGTANGLCLKMVAATAGASLTGHVEFVETAWLGA